MKNECKILAPAGSMNVLPAAVYSGADYVYLSGTKYGARGFADNFNYDELKDAVAFCHEYNVRVFVTVNISICQREFADVVDYIFYLYSHGVDGIIIQDIGLGSVVSSLMPDLELHASTQMTVYDYSLVRWLSLNGYDSVNISREVPLSRIREITSGLGKYDHDISIEVFGHGALCYCYSGRCLMSSFLGGRSGNRGLCAQPCRMRYVLEDDYGSPLTDSTYLLSTRDLCTYHNVGNLVDAGVDCIKIEGRMKPEEYVSGSVYSYREALNGNISRDNYLLLNLAFNRGLTGGYILENCADNVVGRERSGSQGYPMGRVVKVRDNKITIRFTNQRFPTKLVNGDGIRFEYDGESCGMYVSKILSQTKNNITILLNKNISVKEDSMVYITYSKYLHDVTDSIINQKHIHKTVLNLELSINNERQLVVKCRSDNLKETVTFTGEEKFENAVNRPLTMEIINRQLRKTGGTNYEINRITYADFPENLFMPTSSLNNIRRQLIEKVDKIIMNSYLPSKEDLKEVKTRIETFKNNHYKINKTEQTKKQSWDVYIDSPEQAKIVGDYDFIDAVYYDGSFNYDTADEYIHNISDELINISRICPDKKLVWILPQLLPDRDLPHVSEIILKLRFENIDIAVQTDSIGVRDNLDVECFGDHLNIYNNYSIEKLGKNPGFSRLSVSNELSYDDVKLLNSDDTQLEYTVFGNVELMISEDDFKSIVRDDNISNFYLADKRHNRFKLKFDCYNHSHIYDYRILDLSRQLEKIENTNITHLSIDARFFNENDTSSVMNYFENILNNKKDTLKLEEDVEFQECNFKRGMYEKN